MIEIRKAEMNDAERLLQIYDYYVKNTAIIFEQYYDANPFIREGLASGPPWLS